MRERFGAQKLKTRLPSAEMFPRKSEKKRPQVSTVAGVFNYFRSLSFFFSKRFFDFGYSLQFLVVWFRGYRWHRRAARFIIFFFKEKVCSLSPVPYFICLVFLFGFQQSIPFCFGVLKDEKKD